jgi:hypothetical protein
LIYFIFRDDTYVVSSIFTCLMIIGGFAAGGRILLEKGPSRHHVLEDQEILEKYQKIIFHQKTEEARRRRREEPQGGLTHRGMGPPLVAPACGEATLAHYYHRPFTYIIVPKNLSQGGGGSEIDTTASVVQKTPREKSSLAGRNLSEKFLPGEGRSLPSSSSSRWTSSGSSSPSSSSPAPSSPPSPCHPAVTS